MGLRATLTAVMTSVGGIAVGVALALVLLTSSLYQAGLRLGSATERVRLLLELESYALQSVRAPGLAPQPAADIVNRLRATPGSELHAEIERFDGMILSLARASTPSERESTLDALVQDLRSVAAREDENARRAMADAASWNNVAKGAGLGIVLVLLAGTGGVLAWLWRSALQPLLAMVHAIHKFATGDRDARAVEEGPSEIRDIAVAFNHMAMSLSRQRVEQLAFIGGVAHDLRTPLAALRVGVALLDQPAADRVRVRDRIRRQIDRLQDMIGDLLDETRIESGRFDLRLDTCDLRDLLIRVVDIQRDAAPTRDFRLRLPEQPVLLRCDAPRIEQVMGNLLSNATKYSPESSAIEVALTHHRAAAVVSVTDHGIGMTLAEQAKAFEPFRRGGNVGSIGGSGLGLSVTRKIVEAHGGTVEVHSTPGAGSSFHVRLPIDS